MVCVCVCVCKVCKNTYPEHFLQFRIRILIPMNLSDFGDERGALHFAGEFQHGKQHFTSLNQMGEKNLKIKTSYKSKSVQQIMPIAIFRKTDVQQ